MRISLCAFVAILATVFNVTSANNRFSREFSFSRSFSRLACGLFRRPPYCFFFSKVRLLRHTDLLDRLNDGLASPHLHFELSKR